MTRFLLRTALVLTFGCAGATVCRAAFPTVALKAISVGELQAPVNISHAGDGSGRLFICDQVGKVRIIQNGMLLPTPFLDLGNKVIALSASYDERGLLGIAFHPNYNKRDGNNQPLPGFGLFYVFYSAPSPNVFPGPPPPEVVNCRTTVSEFRVSADPNVADLMSERVVLFFDKPQSNHNGGELTFGPDGYLYISVGDGGGANDNNYGHTGGRLPPPNPANPMGGLGNGQDRTKLLGKLLRIDPLGTNGPGGTYGIPATNPLVGQAGLREEIFAYGLRNPWRASFDDGPGGSGRLFLADVGQDRVEEINIIVSGGNYGWRHKEGSFDFDATSPLEPATATLIDPIAQYEHPGLLPSLGLPPLGRSIIGGYLYRGSGFPALQGKYICGDYNASAINSGQTQGSLIGIEETSPNVWSVPVAIPVVGGTPFLSTHVLSMGRDEAGEIYVATEVLQGPQGATGGIYKIVPGTGGAALTPVKDNSIYSDFPANSNAKGDLFAGRTNAGGYRRALLAFDVASAVPPAATINSAQVTLFRTSGNAGNNMSLYRVSQDWGEGTSSGTGTGAPASTGDATWLLPFYSATNQVAWGTPNTSPPSPSGGPFAAAPSATAAPGVYVWNAAGLASDVQGWLTTPSTNFGWILLADETVQSATAQIFSSRENATPTLRPQLQINYTGAPALTRRESWLQQYFVPGHFVDDAGDLDGDGISNLLEYAFAFSPLAFNPPGSGFQVSIAPSGGNVIFTVTFRRDPRATDLTYVLQTSDDLQTWTTIAQSVGGAVPTGSGSISEVDAAGESPVKVVTVQQTLTPAQAKHFARLQVTH